MATVTRPISLAAQREERRCLIDKRKRGEIKPIERKPEIARKAETGRISSLAREIVAGRGSATEARTGRREAEEEIAWGIAVLRRVPVREVTR